MPRATVSTTNPDTIEIEFETFGSPDDPTLLLVMGFTAQLIAWDTAVSYTHLTLPTTERV